MEADFSMLEAASGKVLKILPRRLIFPVAKTPDVSLRSARAADEALKEPHSVMVTLRILIPSF